MGSKSTPLELPRMDRAPDPELDFHDGAPNWPPVREFPSDQGLVCASYRVQCKRQAIMGFGPQIHGTYGFSVLLDNGAASAF